MNILGYNVSNTQLIIAVLAIGALYLLSHEEGFGSGMRCNCTCGDEQFHHHLIQHPMLVNHFKAHEKSRHLPPPITKEYALKVSGDMIDAVVKLGRISDGDPHLAESCHHLMWTVHLGSVLGRRPENNKVLDQASTEVMHQRGLNKDKIMEMFFKQLPRCQKDHSLSPPTHSPTANPSVHPATTHGHSA